MSKRVKRLIAVGATAGALLIGSVAADAARPGPGDKQCVPGQQGNPHPAHKAGAC